VPPDGGSAILQWEQPAAATLQCQAEPVRLQILSC
jgi:hypothetical protein